MSLNFLTYQLNYSVSVWRVLFSRLLEGLQINLQIKTATLWVFFMRLAVFEKLINNVIVDQLDKFGLFSAFQYGFRSSWPTADLLTVVSNNIARDSNVIRTHNHLVCKRTLNHLAKLAKWAVLWALICTVHLTVCYYHITYEFQSESALYSLPECRGTPCSKQAPYLKFKWQQRDSNPQPLS